MARHSTRLKAPSWHAIRLTYAQGASSLVDGHSTWLYAGRRLAHVRHSTLQFAISNLQSVCKICNLQFAILNGSVDHSNVACARTFLRILWSEFNALALTEQLEHRLSHRTSMKKMLDAAFVADEPETLIDQEPCNCPGWHDAASVRRVRSSSDELGNRGQSRHMSAGSQGEAVL